ncbi:hypothetical protein AVEN_114404-1 [Araneus ventricosus]|uniref:Uncharacterized protein n=1 Tax=Araneus ventricosus TaxID=182803 RepID=A0A4Y2P0H4_ARAVE|nr:hypothetical protein AVEN_114404-1 [Araneus ventricosus]
MKDVETSTDVFACGDTERIVFQAANSPQRTLGDCGTADVETFTDAFAFGDTERTGFKTPNSPQPGLGDCEQIHFQHPTNPFLDNPDDLPAETELTNHMLNGITSNQVPLQLYQGENEERPDIDPSSF